MDPPDDEFGGIEFECPGCGTALERFHEDCPECGRALGEEFCALYRPPVSVAARVMALILLVALVLPTLVLLLWYIFS